MLNVNYLVLIPGKTYIKYFYGFFQVYYWKSNELLEENIEKIAKSDRIFTPTFADQHVLMGTS